MGHAVRRHSSVDGCKSWHFLHLLLLQVVSRTAFSKLEPLTMLSYAGYIALHSTGMLILLSFVWCWCSWLDFVDALLEHLLLLNWQMKWVSVLTELTRCVHIFCVSVLYIVCYLHMQLLAGCLVSFLYCLNDRTVSLCCSFEHTFLCFC